MVKEIELERCDEHGLYLYDEGDIKTCKLGCVIHKNIPTLKTIKNSIRKYQDKIMITQNPEDRYYQGVVDTLEGVLNLLNGNPNEIQ